MAKQISTYWKCQLIGWPTFAVVVTVFNYMIWHDPLMKFLPFTITMLVFGILITHLIRYIIKKLDILKERFFKQVLSLAAISISLSAIGTFIWMLLMIKAGFWGIEAEKDKTWWKDFQEEYFFNLFPVMLSICGWVLIYFLFHYVRRIRREEQLKSQYNMQLFELEAKVLRSQMNPHFIFNCLNSIKSLIQENEKEKSVNYLTTFSKLIRTLFNNADKKEITLYDELETCKLYLQLEAMRFDSKFSYSTEIDDSIDLKSIFVPALLIQPFIENAIWHGIMPKENTGFISLKIRQNESAIEITIEDDGIGRDASMQNKAKKNIGHQSKGINLTQSRIELDNLLQKRQIRFLITDKTDAEGKASGTAVRIILEYHN